jgi:hypothetical protein
VTTTKKLAIALGVLILLSPLGLLLPDHFKAGSAWGEWGPEELRAKVGYVPRGLQKFGELWKAPLPDYAFKGWEEKGQARRSAAYVFSGIVGAALVVLLAWLLGRALAGKDK